MAERSLPNRLWYNSLRSLCRLAGVVGFQVRCRGQEFLPRVGGAIVLSNHQSNLDPALVGMATNRRMNYLAKNTLFSPAFAWLFYSVDTIPLDRDGGGLAGLKETLKRLKRGEIVLIFPEGTRTRDGSVQPLKPGFCALARRSKVPLIPVAIDGAFDAWPRWRLIPSPMPIHVQFGPAIRPEELAAMSDEQMVAEAAQRIRACQAKAREFRDRGRPPPDGRNRKR